MSSKNGRIAMAENSGFDMVLDRAFEKLQDKQAQYSIRRLQELDIRLEDLEKELDELIRCNTYHENAE
ncbi:MAG: hypothetical protein LBC62_00305 [Treponema sp.]|jgi:hypothetical protein|nr:hypothetical protein [Treponema sp.]